MITLDGVSVTLDMELFYIYRLNRQVWVGLRQPCTPASCCYSSRESAEVAIRGGE